MKLADTFPNMIAERLEKLLPLKTSVLPSLALRLIEVICKIGRYVNPTLELLSKRSVTTIEQFRMSCGGTTIVIEIEVFEKVVDTFPKKTDFIL